MILSGLGLSTPSPYHPHRSTIGMVQSQNLNYHLTAESKRRRVPRLKGLYGKMQTPGMLQLAGGLPNSSIFPFDGVGATSLTPPFCQGVTEDKLDAEMPLEYRIYEQSTKGDSQGGLSGAGGRTSPNGVSPCDVPIPEIPASSGIQDIDLAVSLQYGSAMGHDFIRDFLKRHNSTYMAPIKFDDWDLMLSVGNTFGWDSVMRTFLEPSDTVFFEEFTFPTALENCQTRGCTTIGVKLDSDGINIEDLEAKLKLHRPKLLYTIPTGQNPTGSVMSTKKRAQLMQLASKYDFLVVEDDPYYYLQMPTETQSGAQSKKEKASLVPSLLHYDIDGRCIRLDSFSKIFAPGIRLGWVIAQQRFIDAMRATAESSSSKPSGFAESLVNGVLQRWGNEGFYQWLVKLQQEYQKRRDLAIDAFYTVLNQHDVSVQSMIKLERPQAGMFFWLRVSRLPPGADSLALEEQLFDYLADECNVLVVPGHWCHVDEDEELDSLYLRVTFASASYDDLQRGGKALASGVASFCKALGDCNESSMSVETKLRRVRLE